MSKKDKMQNSQDAVAAQEAQQNVQTSAFSIKEKDVLPVGIVVDGKRYKDVTVQTLTAGENYTAITLANEGDQIYLIELAASTIVHGLGRPMTYEELANASRQDLHKLQEMMSTVEKKERKLALEGS